MASLHVQSRSRFLAIFVDNFDRLSTSFSTFCSLVSSLVLSGTGFAFFSATGAFSPPFLTAGEKEVRAWQIHKGWTAPQAAGVIHTDFEKGFIKAEVISYDDFVAADGSYAKVKEEGKMRLEGKDYVMRDGDIVEFKFNVSK